MANIYINSLEDLDIFASALLEAVPEGSIPSILLRGEMGTGKTALVTRIIAHMYGSEKCEVASPSFNIYNVYPVRPEVWHWDLYRCQFSLPDEFMEAMDDAKKWNIVEWADFLNPADRPVNFLDINIKLNKNMRLFKITGHGAMGKLYAASLEGIIGNKLLHT